MVFGRQIHQRIRLVALRKCNNCSFSISEYAKSCPKCGDVRPFDSSRRNAWKESVDAAKVSKIGTEKIFSCPECSGTFQYRHILKHGGKNGASCPHCGYPNCKVPCERCGQSAHYFDGRQMKYMCYDHFAEICEICGKLIFENKERHPVLCHRHCSPETKSRNRFLLVLGAIILAILILREFHLRSL